MRGQLRFEQGPPNRSIGFFTRIKTPLVAHQRRIVPFAQLKGCSRSVMTDRHACRCRCCFEHREHLAKLQSSLVCVRLRRRPLVLTASCRRWVDLFSSRLAAHPASSPSLFCDQRGSVSRANCSRMIGRDSASRRACCFSR